MGQIVDDVALEAKLRVLGREPGLLVGAKDVIAEYHGIRERARVTEVTG